MFVLTSVTYVGKENYCFFLFSDACFYTGKRINCRYMEQHPSLVQTFVRFSVSKLKSIFVCRSAGAQGRWWTFLMSCHKFLIGLRSNEARWDIVFLFFHVLSHSCVDLVFGLNPSAAGKQISVHCSVSRLHLSVQRLCGAVLHLEASRWCAVSPLHTGG